MRFSRFAVGAALLAATAAPATAGTAEEAWDSFTAGLSIALHCPIKCYSFLAAGVECEATGILNWSFEKGVACMCKEVSTDFSECAACVRSEDLGDIAQAFATQIDSNFRDTCTSLDLEVGASVVDASTATDDPSTTTQDVDIGGPHTIPATFDSSASAASVQSSLWSDASVLNASMYSLRSVYSAAAAAATLAPTDPSVPLPYLSSFMSAASASSASEAAAASSPPFSTSTLSHARSTVTAIVAAPSTAGSAAQGLVGAGTAQDTSGTVKAMGLGFSLFMVTVAAGGMLV
ncbi:hypothetical protein JCM8097_006500 [Rhodosporidiobolus ruineniae]